MPAASRYWRSGVLYFSANSLAAATTRSSVAALWSDRYASTGLIEQLAFRNSEFHDTALPICGSIRLWLSLTVAHFGLPSNMPAVKVRTVCPSDAVCCTPGTCASFESRRSISVSVS